MQVYESLRNYLLSQFAYFMNPPPPRPYIYINIYGRGFKDGYSQKIERISVELKHFTLRLFNPSPRSSTPQIFRVNI